MDLIKSSLAAIVTFVMILPLSLANAAEVNVLYPAPTINTDLSPNHYQIGGSHSSGVTFLDEFKFSLASAQDILFSIADTVSADTASTPSPSGSVSLFDNTYLTFSIFDSVGNYLGSGAETKPLTVANLAAGQLYTLAVSGKSSGVFGGQYTGLVDIGAVPLGATLPMFSAALLTLCIRRRRMTANS